MNNKETEIMSQSNTTNFEPVQPVVEPVQPVVEPVQPVVEPVPPVVEPVQPVVEPVQPVVEPVQPVVEPVQPVVEPVQPVVEPVQPVVEPVQPVVEQVQPVVEPVQPVVEPVQPVVEPVQPVVEPVQPVVEQVQPVVEPVQPVVEPVQPVVEPVQPVVEPVQQNINSLNPLMNNISQSSMNNVNPSMQYSQKIMNPMTNTPLNNGGSISQNKNNKNLLYIVGGLLVFVIFVVIAIGVIFILKPNYKTLTCTISESATGAEMLQEMKVKIGKKSLKGIDISMKVTVDDDKVDKIDEFVDFLESNYEDMKNLPGVSIKNSKKGNIVKLIINADFDKTNEEAKEKLGFDNVDLNYDDQNVAYNEIKEELENGGYTCK